MLSMESVSTLSLFYRLSMASPVNFVERTVFMSITRCKSIRLLPVFFLLLFASFLCGQSTESIILETPDLQVTLTQGAVTGIVNKLTGESYVDSAAVCDGVGLLHTGTMSITADNAAQTLVRMRGDTVAFSLVSALGDTFSTFARADQQTGEILLWQRGQIKSFGGVYGARMGFTNFDLGAGRLVMPVEGGICIDAGSSVSEYSWEYLTTWESQLVIFEGGNGSLGMWFADSLFAAKRLSLKRSGDEPGLFWEVHNPGDFYRRSTIRTPVLHLKAFAGNWRAPAARYRQWMDAHMHPQKIVEKPAWIDSIGCVVIYRNIDQLAMLDSLAKWLDPRPLIYAPDWRRDGYDVNYPDYTPRDGAKIFVDYAHARGFRVMLHVNPFGVAPYNPMYERFKAYQLVNPFTGDPYGWRWNTGQAVRHAFINPASTELQDMFIDKMRQVMETLNMDAVHLDVDFAAFNSDHGILNGENPAQGNRTFNRRLAEALPAIVWGGENLTEVNLYRDTFAQRWRTKTAAWQPHPISTFLYSRYTLPVGYLGFVNPDNDPDLYMDYMNCYERWGVLPTLGIASVDDLLGPRTQELIHLADLWGRLGLRPDFDSEWDEATVFRFKGRHGERAEYRKTAYGSNFIVDGDSLYRKISGVNRVSTSGSIAGWFSYNADEIFGLSPDAVYWLDDEPRDLQVPHVHDLSADVLASHVSLSTQGGHISLRDGATTGRIDLLDRMAEATTAIRKNGEILPLGDGAFVLPADITLGGVAKRGLETHPPYENGPGDVLITWSLALPDSPYVRLSFFAGMDEGAKETDGVMFFVEVDGEQIFSVHVIEKVWRHFEVDLSQWRGRTISLTIGNSPGPPGSTTWWDWARWGEVRVLTSGARSFRARLYFTDDADIYGGEVVGRDGALYEISGKLPAELVYVAGQQQATLPFHILQHYQGNFGVQFGDLYFHGKSQWGSGALQNVSCGGVSKQAINAHPPGKGSTVIQQTLTLPSVTPLTLSGSYGIADGAATTGVNFAVYVNGRLEMNRTTTETRWNDFAVDLSPFAGRGVLIEFVVSPGADNYYDWANWAELLVSHGPVNAASNAASAPTSFRLSQPRPNPFNSQVTLTLRSPHKGVAEWRVVNIIGQQLFSDKVVFTEAGERTLRWNGVNESGAAVGSGIYFVNVSFGERRWLRKVLLIK